MTEYTFRWVVGCIAVVIVVCTLGCTVAWVAHPHEWMCTVNDMKQCQNSTPIESPTP